MDEDGSMCKTMMENWKPRVRMTVEEKKLEESSRHEGKKRKTREKRETRDAH